MKCAQRQNRDRDSDTAAGETIEILVRVSSNLKLDRIMMMIFVRGTRATGRVAMVPVTQT